MSYSPRQATPQTIEELRRYMHNELQNISEAFEFLDADFIRFRVHHVEPSKPREGQAYYADGTDWDPGGGAGLYEYTGGGTNGWRQLANGTQY